MPAFNAPAKVLVTGANGFLAVHIINTLLAKGFSVRGTLRSDAKAPYLQTLFAAYGDKFEWVVIPDVLTPGAFDEAVKDVDGIVHVSSPLPQVVNDVNDVLKPAVDGLVALMESARKNGDPTVKRIVITSSIGAVEEPKDAPYTHTEDDWNESALKNIAEQGPKAVMSLYESSKVMEERAAIEYVSKHKPNFDIVRLNPGYIFGPPLDEVASPETMCMGSSKLLYLALTQRTLPGVPSSISPTDLSMDRYADVRDVAELHVLSLMTERAGGERILIVARNFTWQEALDALNSVEPKLSGVPVGMPGWGNDVIHQRRYNTDKVKEIFEGFEYRSLLETVKDTWVEYQRRGWVTP